MPSALLKSSSVCGCTKVLIGLCQILLPCLLCFIMEHMRCCYPRENTASFLISSHSHGSFSLNSWWLPNEQKASWKLACLNKTDFSGHCIGEVVCADHPVIFGKTVAARGRTRGVLSKLCAPQPPALMLGLFLRQELYFDLLE